MNMSISKQKFTRKPIIAFTFLVLQFNLVNNVHAVKLTLNGQPTLPNNQVLNLTEDVVYSYGDMFRPIVTNTDEPFVCIGPNLDGTPTANVSIGMSSSDPFRIYGLVDVASASYDYSDALLADKSFDIQTNSNSQCVVKGFVKVDNPSPGTTLIFSDSFEDGGGVIPMAFSDITITLLENNTTNELPNNLILSNAQDFVYQYEVKNIGNEPITLDIVDYFSIANNSTVWSCDVSFGADLATECGSNENNPDFNPGTTDTYNGAVYLKDAHIENTDESIIITVTRNPIITVDNTSIDILASALSTGSLDIFKLNNSDTRLFVGNTNTAPVISSVSNQTILEDSILGTGSLAFTVSDVETPAASLSVSATSSNQGLVSDANIILGGSGNNRTVSVVSNTNANTAIESVTITLSVNDGVATSNSSFDLDITPVNDAPTFTTAAIADFPAGTTGPQGILNFIQGVVFGPTTDENSQSLIDSSILNVSDPNGVLSSAMFLGTDLFIPLSGQGGTVVFDVVIQDDGGVINAGSDTSDPVSVSFTVLNTLPVISSVSDDSMNEDDTSSAIAFTISDAETPSTALVMTALSSDPSIIPVSGIQFSGTGGSRTVQITPSLNQNTSIAGPVTITLVVDDGSNTSQTTFEMTINPINDAPTFSLEADIVKDVADAGMLISELNYAVALTMGPTADEDLSQNVLNYIIQVTDTNNIFDENIVSVAINNNGTLNYVLSGNAGTATILVSLQDDGTTANGGVDTSATQSFTVTAQ